jgi:hypothetical protein
MPVRIDDFPSPSIVNRTSTSVSVVLRKISARRLVIGRGLNQTRQTKTNLKAKGRKGWV